MAQQTIGIGSAPNDGTGDPIRDAFDKCNDNFTELYTGLTGLLDFKGSTDASGNPNYPAASKGDFYLVSVAGKIGGASGVDVEAGDSYFATADNAGGDQATVGTSWTVLQGNTTAGSGGVDVEDEGIAVATATIINFTGAGVTATDAGGGQVDVTIAGGGSGIDVEDEGVSEATGASTLNFTGAGVTATDMGAGVVDVDIPGGGGSFRGALVTKAADQTTANYSSNTAVGWDSESYDTDSIHESVTNPSRMSVPSGVTKVKLIGSLHLTSIASGDTCTLRIGKNGGVDNYTGAASTVSDISGLTRRMNLESPVLTVVGGTDYFELFLVTGGDASITVEADSSWFAMEIIE